MVLILIRFKSGSELLWISPLAAAIAIVLFTTPPHDEVQSKNRVFFITIPSINGLPLLFAGTSLIGEVFLSMVFHGCVLFQKRPYSAFI